MPEPPGPVDLPFDAMGPADAPPVILLHGFPMSRAIWTPTLVALGSSLRAIAPDLRGHGAAPAPDEPAGMETMARDVLALADKLGLATFGLVGHSMGGYVALALLRIAPERVSRLALVATRASPDSPEAKQARRKQADMVQMDGMRALADLLVPKLLAPRAKDLVRAELRLIIESSRVSGAVRSLEAMADRPDAAAVLSTIKQPTLVIACGEDVVMPRAEQERMARTIPNARLEVLEPSGHVPMMEEPQKLASLLSSHFRG